MMYIFLIVALIFSILNFALLLSFVRLASDLIDMIQESKPESNKLIATEEPGLIDIDMNQPNYSGLPIRLD